MSGIDLAAIEIGPNLEKVLYVPVLAVTIAGCYLLAALVPWRRRSPPPRLPAPVLADEDDRYRAWFAKHVTPKTVGLDPLVVAYMKTTAWDAWKEALGVRGED